MENKFSSALGKLPQPVPLSAGLSSPRSPSVNGAPKASNPLTAKVTAILSTSYSDVEFREALSLLDSRGIENNAKTRRQIRLDIHKEVIDSNGAIIDEFGHVAEVGPPLTQLQRGLVLTACTSNCASLEPL